MIASSITSILKIPHGSFQLLPVVIKNSVVNTGSIVYYDVLKVRDMYA